MHHLMVSWTLLLLFTPDIHAQTNETETIDAQNSTEIVTTMDDVDAENSTEIVTTMGMNAGNSTEMVTTTGTDAENSLEIVATTGIDAENATETVPREESSQKTSSNNTQELDQVEDGKCGQHEVWKECSGCESTCEQMKVICDDRCGEPKCQCDVGYFRYAPRKCITYWECKHGVIEL